MKYIKRAGLWLGRKLVHAYYVPNGTEQCLSLNISEEKAEELRRWAESVANSKWHVFKPFDHEQNA